MIIKNCIAGAVLFGYIGNELKVGAVRVLRVLIMYQS